MRSACTGVAAVAMLGATACDPGHGGELPTSPRSREVVARVSPTLGRELEEKGLRLGSPIFIRIFKQERQLELWVRGRERFELFRSYRIAAMSGTLGPKRREGDLQAPEGFYFVTPSRMNPHSRFHLSFDLGYPNAYDRAHDRSGSALMVHGSNVSIGCYAMTDPVIEEIYTLAEAALRGGQTFFRVHCFPFRMTADNLQRQRDSEWFDFWQNLKSGYDWFEEHAHPPDVRVKERRYVFGEAE